VSRVHLDMATVGSVVVGAEAQNVEPGLARYVLIRLSQGTTVDDLLAGMRHRMDAVATALDLLLRDGLVEPRPDGPVDPRAVIEHVRARSRRRAHRAGLAELRNQAYGRDATTAHRALTAEWLYMSKFGEHVQIAIDRSRPSLAVSLRGYLAEELSHVEPVGRGLGPIDPRDMALADPLVDFLRATPLLNIPAYLMALAVLEGAGGDLDGVTREFDRVALTGLPAAVWQPFRDHAVLDAVEAHGDTFADLLGDGGNLSGIDLEHCLGVADAVADCLVDFFSAIVDGL
jgi:hypothetical protein